ncbi:MAG TPA: dTDP-4-dehydrorhamnose reductase [Acidimicrobiia bacterium]|nr:dTDP-4-dehydrorhamnose reductase [Acidimicrobiia bacterium]
MRIFVTGAGGQVGHEVAARFHAAERHTVVAADHATLDVGDRDAVLQAITSTRPDVVVHCAAWTAVDACEGDPDRAFLVNALGTRYVAEACARTDAHLITISTDYVFDGDQPEPYVEWDRPNPRSVYGRSKLASETEAAGCTSATVVRTSWVCGAYGANMVKTILRLAAEHDTLTFVDDQRGHPSFADDLAVMLERFAIDRRPGVFHVTNQGAVSWYEFAREVLSAAGLDADRVKPISTAELTPPRPAPRPRNSVLDNAALRLGGVPLLPDFREPLSRLVKQLTA